MHRCYLPQADFAAGTLTIEGEEAHHALRVMRLRAGDVCEVFDGAGQAARVQVLSGHGSSMTVQVQELLPAMAPVAGITLALAVPKGNNMELIVQKAVELGVTAIVPVITARSIVRVDGKDAEKKRVRLQRIAA